MTNTVPSTQFQNQAGRYIDEAAKEPVFITRYSRPLRVLLDIAEYERLRALDTRKAFYTRDLPEEWFPALAAANVDHIDTKLNQLLD